MPHREYILAAQPLRTVMGTYVREIFEITGDQQKAFLVVQDNPDVVDTLEAIRLAYANGRQDQSKLDHPEAS